MQLKSLELSGFKSFGKKAELSFNTPITAIVGPNGSGKSNVAESFRFVLGEQSIKSLRGKKTEDLIFNGSKDMPRGNRAAVKVVFDNSKRILNVDFDEVSIERVIYRDSSSEYLINGSQVRLRDIIELLAQAHIGSSGHHIISQGEADRVLSANIKERRQMVEDALGLKIYQYKKEEARRKLEKTDENIKQVESLRREIAPHLKFLKKQVEKVEKAREMKTELASLYQEYLKREETYLSYFRNKLAEERREPEVKLDRLEKELAEARRVLESSKNKDHKSDQVISVEAKIQKVRRDKDSASREIGRVEGAIDYEQRRIKKLTDEAEKNSNISVPLKAVESLKDGVERESNEAGEDLARLRLVISNLIGRIKSLVEEYRNKSDNQAIEDAKQNLKRLEEDKVKSLAVLEDLTRSEKEFEKEYAEIKREIEKEKDVNREAEKALFRIVAEQKEANAELQSVRAKEETLVVEESNFKREIQEGMALIGREISQFDQFVVAENGVNLSAEIIAHESRQIQDERRRRIEKIKLRLEDSGAGDSAEIMKEYQETTERDAFLERELTDLFASAKSLDELIKDLEMRLDIEFKEGIKKINTEFQNFFSLMFGGGHASLEVIREKKKRRNDEELSALMGEVGEMESEEEDGEEGIDIHVSLPQKKVKGLVMLSGGERALTSIALIFAMSQVNPPPFLILDETDAALDEANSRRYGDMIENLSKYSQLILITHNRETMSRAGVLYGVTMASGGDSKLLSIQFDQAVEVAK